AQTELLAQKDRRSACHHRTLVFPQGEKAEAPGAELGYQHLKLGCDLSGNVLPPPPPLPPTHPTSHKAPILPLKSTDAEPSDASVNTVTDLISDLMVTISWGGTLQEA